MGNLTKQQFEWYLLKSLRKYLGDRKVILKTIDKINVEQQNVILIKDDVKNIYGIFYMNQWYEKYQQGDCLEDIVARIIVQARKSCLNFSVNLLETQSFQKIRNRIFFRIVEYKRNEKALKNVAFERKNDLAMVYYLLLDMDFHDQMKISCVKQTMLKRWGISEESFQKVAMRNTIRLFPPKIREISKVFSVSLPGFYLATNVYRMHGAGVIFYPNLLKKFCEEKGVCGMFLLPSSIHEMVFVLDNRGVKIAPQKLFYMVSKINKNRECTRKEDVLTTNVYYYNLKEDRLKALF